MGDSLPVIFMKRVAIVTGLSPPPPTPTLLVTKSTTPEARRVFERGQQKQEQQKRPQALLQHQHMIRQKKQAKIRQEREEAKELYSRILSDVNALFQGISPSARFQLLTKFSEKLSREKENKNIKKRYLPRDSYEALREVEFFLKNIKSLDAKIELMEQFLFGIKRVLLSYG
ncbi:MAG TPA: hypothetical protein VNK03_07470 [Gammaproteobacteria bacterium]|nr:hypothetical protein [Gammaproteobacteria bacterium]